MIKMETQSSSRFTDEDVEAINCESTWRRNDDAETTSVSCQTRDLETYDVGIMSIETYDTGSQTSFLHQTTTTDLSITEDFLDAFHIAAKRMMKELKKSRTKAFENYNVLWEDQEDSISCLLSMNEPGTEKFFDMPVTGLSWNCTGSVIAASYGHVDHNDWCNHKSKLCLWNINRHDKSARKPDNSIDMDSCITCVKFHDSSPGLLAAGTFGGNVVVWDQAKDDTASGVLISDPQQDSQGDSISQVSWMVEKRKNNVISISNTGRVNIWTVSQKGSLTVLKSLRIEVPHTFKLRLKSNSVGVSVQALDPADSSTFLLGTESGHVVKCTRDSDSVNAVLSYKSHSGPVYGVEYSKLMRNVFITCGTDGCINLYTTLQESPLMSLEPCQGYLYSCRFSPTNSAILAVGGSRGKVVFYNLIYSHLAPFHVLDCCEKRTPVRSVEFNQRYTNLLATGDGRGLVKVWTLGADLASEAQSIIPIIRDALVKE